MRNKGIIEKFVTGEFPRLKTYLCNDTDTLSCQKLDSNHRELYSYNTMIAYFDVPKNMVFLSDLGLSSTTSKHRQDLLSALADTDIKSYLVPVKVNQKTMPSFDELLGRFEARMDSVSIGNDLALADNRREYMRNYNLYLELIKVTGITPINKGKYDDLANKISDTEYIKMAQRERRKFLANKNKVYAETISNKEYFSN